MGIKGYKVFNSDWTCKGFQYKVGEIYEMEGYPKICERGFHFCSDLKSCFEYYPFSFSNKFAEVLALGSIDGNCSRNEDKVCTNKIKIVREISLKEVFDLTNDGKNNLGYGNLGNFNTGILNDGFINTGSHNKGTSNTGDYNKGSDNTGCNNKGFFNTGNFNIGSSNTGDYNKGYNNIGPHNKGDFNIGFRNTGYFNIGDFNKTNNSIGCFNTKKSTLYIFNKPTDWTIQDWKTSQAYSLLKRYFFYKQNQTGTSKNEWWLQLSENEKQEILSLPNFDADIFKEITGINVKED